MGNYQYLRKRGIIKLIPKRDKDSTFVKNLRPITLLNVDVKILSRALAARLQSVIASIITKDQNAFIKGRNIGENILDVYSMIAAAEDNEETDILVFLDVEKAYDTVSWRFLSTVLDKLDFPDSFVRWVEILHRNKEIRFFNHGYSSSPVYPNKGLAQGCALSPLLFIIAMSRLSEVVNRNANIVGINCAGKIKKCCLAADDTVIGTRANERNIQELCYVLNSFYKISGLKVNYNKSAIMTIGKHTDVRQLASTSEEFVWLNSGDKIKYLGIFVSDKYHLKDNECLLLLNSNDIANITHGLRYQNLSLIGRILILKSLVSSKLVYKFLHYPLPEQDTLKWINKVYFDFVWRGRHRISAEDMIQPVEKGGFNMLNVFYECEALQFQWLSKTLTNVEERAVWEHYLRSCILIPLEQFLCCNCFPRAYYKMIKNVNSMPAFWHNLFKIWFKETYVRNALKENFLNEDMKSKGILFNSVCNRLGKKTAEIQLGYYEWLKAFGCFTFEEVKEVWQHLSSNDQETIMELFDRPCRQAILHYFSGIDITSNKQTLVSVLLQPTTRTKQIYLALRDKNFGLPVTKIAKWERGLNIEIRDEWLLICKRSLSIYNSRLRAFHILFLHRAFHLNCVRAKYTSCSDLCTFCNSNPETFYHLIWECPLTQRCWRQSMEFAKEYCCTALDVLSPKNCLLSNFSSCLLVVISTFFKHFILLCKYDEAQPSFPVFLLMLQKFRDQDFLRHKYRKRIEDYYTFWCTLVRDECFDC